MSYNIWRDIYVVSRRLSLNSSGYVVVHDNGKINMADLCTISGRLRLVTLWQPSRSTELPVDGLRTTASCWWATFWSSIVEYEMVWAILECWMSKVMTEAHGRGWMGSALNGWCEGLADLLLTDSHPTLILSQCLLRNPLKRASQPLQNPVRRPVRCSVISVVKIILTTMSM